MIHEKLKHIRIQINRGLRGAISVPESRGYDCCIRNSGLLWNYYRPEELFKTLSSIISKKTCNNFGICMSICETHQQLAA
jgi:hypothetical protein